MKHHNYKVLKSVTNSKTFCGLLNVSFWHFEAYTGPEVGWYKIIRFTTAGRSCTYTAL